MKEILKPIYMLLNRPLGRFSCDLCVLLHVGPLLSVFFNVFLLPFTKVESPVNDLEKDSWREVKKGNWSKNFTFGSVDFWVFVNHAVHSGGVSKMRVVPCENWRRKQDYTVEQEEPGSGVGLGYTERGTYKQWGRGSHKLAYKGNINFFLAQQLYTLALKAKVVKSDITYFHYFSKHLKSLNIEIREVGAKGRFNGVNHCKKKNAKNFYQQKFSNPRHLLCHTFTKGLWKSKKFGQWTLESGGKKTVKQI